MKSCIALALLTLAGALTPAGVVGASRADVVKVTVYLADIDQYAAMNEVYRDFFQTSFPARIVIESPMMLDAIRAPSSITQLRETTLSTISAVDPMTLPSRTMLLRTIAFPSRRAAS